MKLTPGQIFLRQTTVCFKDCGLYIKNIDMMILFACLVGWLHSSPVEIKKKIKAQSLKSAWAGTNNSMHKFELT